MNSLHCKGWHNSTRQAAAIMMCRNHLWSSIEGWGCVFMEITQPCLQSSQVKKNKSSQHKQGHIVPWEYWAPPYDWPPWCFSRWSRELDRPSGSCRPGPPDFQRSLCAPEDNKDFVFFSSSLSYDIIYVVCTTKRYICHRDLFALVVGTPRQGDANATALCILTVEHYHLRIGKL